MQPKNFYGVILAFQASAKYEALAAKYEGRIRLRSATWPDIQMSLGHYHRHELRPSSFSNFLMVLPERPAVQRRALVALKSLESWAVVRDMLPRAITTGCETVGGEGANEPWSDATYCYLPSNMRPALILPVWLHWRQIRASVVATWCECGGRILKLIKGHPGINVTPGKDRQSPLGSVHRKSSIEKMNTWERRPGFIVTKRNGEPWTRPHLSQEWWKELQKNEALAPLKAAGLSFHGLRASAVIRLRRAGCTEGEIASMVGMSVPMVSRYCRRSEQKDNALAALARWEGLGNS